MYPHSFLVKLMDRLINDHPEQLQGIMFHLMLLIGFILFAIFMIAPLFIRNRKSLITNQGGER